MITIEDIIAKSKAARRKPDEEELRRLPDQLAEVHGRLSDWSQVKNSKESVREIATLVDLAKQDGFKTGFSAAQVEQLLNDIQNGVKKPALIRDGEVILNLLGLGISAKLPEYKRPDIKVTFESLEKRELGAIYVTEGANRLSRDPDGVVSSKLLRLMKESNCKLRTPRDVLSPQIERDWQIIHDELEEAAKELKRMRIRCFYRKQLKAKNGEFVGEPVPPGFILPIVGQKPNGKYLFGKIQPYPPHSEVDVRILQEFIRHRGSRLLTAQALKGLTFPFFPPELKYMERLSSLRHCLRTSSGYVITTDLIRRLVTNLKLIGIWQWGDGEPILHNHDRAVPVELFLPAYELGTSGGKLKGRATYSEPLEWAGLLWCCNHSTPRLVSSRSKSGKYTCEADYHNGQGPVCFRISQRFIEEPLTTEVLRRLDFTPYAEEVLAKLEAGALQGKVEETQRNREIAELERKLQNLKPYLGCGDPEREEVYWEQYRETSRRLEDLKSTPVPKGNVTAADIARLREFLAGLPENWQRYSGSLRNRLLKLLIERVELRHSKLRIEATIIWKAGLEQKVTIQRPFPPVGCDKRWTAEENKLLEMLWPSSSPEVLRGALPNRTWRAIAGQAQSHGLKRERTHPPARGPNRPWTSEEEARVKALYEGGVPLQDIMVEVGRSPRAILFQAFRRQWLRPRWAKWRKRQVTWETQNLKVLQQQSCRSWHAPGAPGTTSLNHSIPMQLELAVKRPSPCGVEVRPGEH